MFHRPNAKSSPETRARPAASRVYRQHRVFVAAKEAPEAQPAVTERAPWNLGIARWYRGIGWATEGKAWERGGPPEEGNQCRPGERRPEAGPRRGCAAEPPFLARPATERRGEPCSSAPGRGESGRAHPLAAGYPGRRLPVRAPALLLAPWGPGRWAAPRWPPRPPCRPRSPAPRPARNGPGRAGTRGEGRAQWLTGRLTNQKEKGAGPKDPPLTPLAGGAGRWPE